ncbi:MAG: esterase [Candidatus Marinimicrobia bacterium]|nr:esterase [Candidatus Neomarinimicrobiota bacterium]
MKPMKIVPVILAMAATLLAQWPAPTPNDTLASIRIMADNRVKFQIYAPQAAEVKLGSSDIPGTMLGLIMKKQGNGVWEVTTDPVPAGSYRYNFAVDGIRVMDSKNPMTSQANSMSWSLFHIKGNNLMDLQNVPHGAVAEVYYPSQTLGRQRRMHVYTPPGYENNLEKYPVFYLLHGASDSDDSWSSVGRAGFILDNLLAEDKIKPMIVVMPDGHTGPWQWGQPLDMEEFVREFNDDVMLFIESHYRILEKPEYRAIAGLSMGGAQTLNIAIPRLEMFGYFGVFSSGIFGIVGNMGQPPANPSWEEMHKDDLAKDKSHLKLCWFATGKDDFLVETSRASVEMLRNNGFNVTYNESPGGHTWLNWRDYLIEFLPLLFQ